MCYLFPGELVLPCIFNNLHLSAWHSKPPTIWPFSPHFLPLSASHLALHAFFIKFLSFGPLLMLLPLPRCSLPDTLAQWGVVVKGMDPRANLEFESQLTSYFTLGRFNLLIPQTPLLNWRLWYPHHRGIVRINECMGVHVRACVCVHGVWHIVSSYSYLLLLLFFKIKVSKLWRASLIHLPVFINKVFLEHSYSHKNLFI